MKKLNVLFLSLLIVGTFSCKKKTDDVTDPEVEDPSTIVLQGNLNTMKLDASKKYLLKGQVFVNAGKKLTIPAGTVIMGDKATKAALIINVGGQIFANGTAAKPIIFTSAQAKGARDEGDWSGVILLGDASVNQSAPTIEGISPAVTYGGIDDADNSGSMTYCRIEFAGIALTPNNETNGLTFGGVGSGTTIDYVQNSYGGDDSFEWFGGTVNCKHLVSYAAWDDDFDTDFGYSGKVEFAVAIRDPFRCDQSTSNGFESDNDANGSTNTPLTSAIFSNVTMLGPIYDSTQAIGGTNGRGAHLRRNTNQSIYNSVFVGWLTGLLIETSTNNAQNHYAPNGTSAAFSGNMMIKLQKAKTTATASFGDATNTGLIYNASGQANDAPVTSVNNTAYYAALASAGLDVSMQYGLLGLPSDPNLAVTSGTLTSGAVSVPNGSGFFSGVSYRGAFSSTDWTDGWGEFDPINAKY